MTIVATDGSSKTGFKGFKVLSIFSGIQKEMKI
jgi:hypothetical protein